uniref:hypothetical protein n=1 Tax=Candidatus Electrothrix sp. TaxID=2170559 RepID=UPI0040572EF4
MHKIKFFRISCLLLFAVLTFSVNESFSRDTDIYKISTKQNCYILMDNSGSMDFGVYEHTIDYGEMFDYLYCLDSDGGQTACGNQY